MPTEQYDQATRLRALQELGVVMPIDLVRIQQSPISQAQVMLTELKLRVKKTYQRLVLVYHPDQTGNDEVKTAWFKVLTYEHTEFQNLQVRANPPMPPPMRVVVHPMHPMNPMWTGTGGATTTSAVGFGVGGFHFVQINFGIRRGS